MEHKPFKHDIKPFTKTTEEVESIWRMWQAAFPTWPLERQRLEKILTVLPGHHFIHEKGFCLSYLADGTHGQIAAIGVLPEHRRNGLGSDLLARAIDGLRDAAHGGDGGELKSVEIGSSMPRFWPQMPKSMPQDVKDFFTHRGIGCQQNILIACANML